MVRRFRSRVWLVSLALAGCAEDRLVVEGSLKGKDGRALEGAFVTMQFQSQTQFATSDARGAFRIRVERQLGVAPLRLAVSAAGHAPIETQFPAGGIYRCEITLAEGASGKPPTALPWARICAKTEASPNVPETRP